MVPKNEKYFKPQGHMDGYIYETVVTWCFPLQINSSSHKIIWWNAFYFVSLFIRKLWRRINASEVVSLGKKERKDSLK